MVSFIAAAATAAVLFRLRVWLLLELVGL